MGHGAWGMEHGAQDLAFFHVLNYDNSNINLYERDDKSAAFSVRCVKD
jgi:hypothetical protein